MDYVKSCSYVDYSKLVLAGCSQGGFVSGLVATDYPEEVKELILPYPALCISDDARKGKMQAFTFDPSDVPDVIEAHGKKLNGDYARLVMEEVVARRITLFMQGYDEILNLTKKQNK
jgi:pimeloyl-ACP methyl ester carboxylesterase